MPGGGRIFVRFRNISILLFALVFCLTAAAMTAAFGGVIRNISLDYAQHYAISSANALSARIVKELDLIALAARSGAVAEWLADEDDEEKKRQAHGELADIVRQLHSYNLYVGVEASRNEYRIEPSRPADEMAPLMVLEESRAGDEWYFNSIASENEYLLDVDIDEILRRKRVWLDYKVVRDGAPLGVICTGLEFSHIAGELFFQYEDAAMRGLIVDQDGVIHIDSTRLNDPAFLHDILKTRIEDEFSHPAVLNAIRAHLGGGDHAWTDWDAVSMRLPSGPYRYMTIAPVRHTGWVAVSLFDASAMWDISMFLPVLLVMLALLIAFALAVHAVSYRLIFRPLGQLSRSLKRLREDTREPVYGVGRDDELGNIAGTIQDLFTKSYYDALTGICNRRYLENNLQHYLEFLSRSGGYLSVLMLDVDFFKKYNDAYGHEQGDICLRAVAQALAGSMARSNDFAARYGGEEFVAVLPNTDEAGARRVAEKALAAIRALEIPHADSSAAPHVTVSAGVTTGKAAHRQSWEDYINRADKALYMSKQGGRDRYTYLDFGETGKGG